MLNQKELCEGLIALGYWVKWVNYGGQPRIIVWQGSAPVADVLRAEEGHYNIEYRTFQQMDTVDQIQLSTLIVQYAFTPMELRE